MKTYLLVDAKNLLWRAEAAMSTLRGNGHATGGIHGFLSVLLRVVETYEPTRVVICWDCWQYGPKARWKISPTYKQRDPEDDTRSAAHERVLEQSLGLREFFQKLDVKQARSPKWEADDVMGTLAKRYAKRGKVIIFTGDRDLLQCVSDRVMVLRPVKGGDLEEENEKTVEAKYGVTVKEFVTWKALVGDASDGYAGCKGIGEKSATAIVKAAGHDLEAVLHLATTDAWAPLSARWAAMLHAQADDVRDCLKLATINTDAPLKFVKRERDFKAAQRMLFKWKMRVMSMQFSKLKLLAWGGT